MIKLFLNCLELKILMPMRSKLNEGMNMVKNRAIEKTKIVCLNPNITVILGNLLCFELKIRIVRVRYKIDYSANER